MSYISNYVLQIGRLKFTSPSQINISASPGGKQVTITGKLGGAENEVDHLKYIRDELSSMAACDEVFPLQYNGDTSLNGFVKILSANLDTTKYVLGGFGYSVQLEYLGREGDVNFESRLTGSILENNHSISSTTEQFHAPPGNHYAYFHNNVGASNTRTASNLETTSATDTTTLYLKTGASIRSSNAQYSVDIEDYYKGACRVSMGQHTEHNYATNSSSSIDSVRHGKYAGQWNVGDSLIIENGLIKMVLGTSTTQSKFKTYIWDETAYSTEQEWAFSLGDPVSGSHLGTEYDGWHRVQILTNRPEVVVVRCTTFKDTDKSGRLVVDFALRRGAHHMSIISNSHTAGTPLNISLSTAPSTNASATNLNNGYLKDGTTSPEDGNFWILGSPHDLESNTSITNRGMIQRATNGSTFSAVVGYELVDSSTSAPLGHNDADSVFKQYIDNVNEAQRIIKA
jgi:hypothetical protein